MNEESDMVGNGCLLVSVLVAGAAFLLSFMFMGLDGKVGEDAAYGSTSTSIQGAVSELKVGSKTIKMPTTVGKIGLEEDVDALAAKGQYITFNGKCNDEEKKWYVNMRWPYVEWAWNGRTRNADYSTVSLYAKKRVIVYNPKTKLSVVTAICESGPAPWTGSSWYATTKDNDTGPSFWAYQYHRFEPPQADGRVAGLPPAPWNAIKAEMNDVLEYGFAADQNLPLGPLTTTP